MLRTDVLLSSVGEAFDLKKDYWQLPSRPQDTKKIVFAPSKGLFQFPMMPFNLHGVVKFHGVGSHLGPCEGFTLA